MERVFQRFEDTLPKECLVIWNTTLPISKNARGGFLVPEVEFMNSTLRLDILEANFYARQIVANHGYDVLDLHYYLRNQLHRRAEDGIHWDMTAHRRITNLILTHIADAWNEKLPGRCVVAKENEGPLLTAPFNKSPLEDSYNASQKKVSYESAHRRESASDKVPYWMNSWEKNTMNNNFSNRNPLHVNITNNFNMQNSTNNMNLPRVMLNQNAQHQTDMHYVNPTVQRQAEMRFANNNPNIPRKVEMYHMGNVENLNQRQIDMSNFNNNNNNSNYEWAPYAQESHQNVTRNTRMYNRHDTREMPYNGMNRKR